MRIVAGRWRGRTIRAPRDERVRPTSDRVREAWMSIVQPWLPGARVLDLFAGSGALGLEALSRGAESAELVELSPSALRVMGENVAALGATSARIRRGDAVRFAEGLSFGAYDVAFADPPYRLGLARRIAELWLVTPFAHVLGVEHEARETLPGDGVTRRYGDTAITFFQTDAPAPDDD